MKVIVEESAALVVDFIESVSGGPEIDVQTSAQKSDAIVSVADQSHARAWSAEAR